MRTRTLVWYRGKDLRVADHAPLRDAAEQGEVVCAFVLDPYFFAPHRAQQLPHRMQLLLESIASLQKNLEALGSGLVLVSGKSVDVLPDIARAWRADRVVAHRWSEPFGRERDDRIAKSLHVPLELFEGETLAAPGEVRTGEGRPYAVFTPFARAHRQTVSVGRPLAAPRSLPPLPALSGPRATLPALEELGISRNPRLLPGGERGARDRLARFLSGGGARYHLERDRLDLAASSRLSQDLKFGLLSARTVWTSARARLEPSHPEAWKSFSNELLWREFTHDVLREHPRVLREPYRSEFASFPWQKDDAAFRAWCEGKTGYPVVDAAARQLLGEGFVHNRARMIAASFLVKDLRVDFRRGEAHYMKYLADGDWAQNDFGWQWSAGCGFDAQPFFRVFNPVAQGQKFDPEGAYVRRWVPELAALPAEHIHAPWQSPPGVLAAAGVALGETYPRPIVDHAVARTAFLALAEHL